MALVESYNFILLTKHSFWNIMLQCLFSSIYTSLRNWRIKFHPNLKYLKYTYVMNNKWILLDWQSVSISPYLETLFFMIPYRLGVFSDLLRHVWVLVKLRVWLPAFVSRPRCYVDACVCLIVNRSAWHHLWKPLIVCNL